MNLRDDFHFVVAIDFGTTYTGYAYSTRHEFHTNPLNINLMTWNAGSSLSPKAPTCVLFKPDKTFHSFGYQAEDRYNELAMDGEHREWFFCGTIDITVNEVLKGGFLKEIYEANGGDWGGTKVDASFEEFLEIIVGKPAFKHFKTNEVTDFIDLQRNFEVKKRNLKLNDPESKSTIAVPYPLMESFRLFNPGKGLPEATKDTGFSPEDVEWKSNKIRLSQSKTRALFDSSLTYITKHVSDILRQPKVSNCEAILMVGGYSECQYLQEAIRSIAGSRRLIIPSGAGLAVLKGAVINGHRPETLSQRICKYTYGITVRNRFGVDGYDKYRIVDDDGEVKCENCFKTFVSKGSHVSLGESSVTKSVIVGDSSATGILLPLYASTSECPKYVTDDSCQKIGLVTLDMPDITLGKERGANVTLYFGGTEIQLTAVDKHTGNKISSCFDFLG